MAKKGLMMNTVDAVIASVNADLRALGKRENRYATVACVKCGEEWAVDRPSILINADVSKRVREWKPVFNENGQVVRDLNGRIKQVPARMAGHCRCGKRLPYATKVFENGSRKPVGLTTSGEASIRISGAVNLDDSDGAPPNDELERDGISTTADASEEMNGE